MSDLTRFLATDTSDQGIAYRARCVLRALRRREAEDDLTMEGERALMSAALVVTGDRKYLDRMNLKRDELEKVKAAERKAEGIGFRDQYLSKPLPCPGTLPERWEGCPEHGG